MTEPLDAVGNRLSMTDSSGTTLYTPDDLGRVTEITNPFQETTSFVYNALGREVEQQQANGVRVQHVYDAAGREEVLRHVTGTGELLFEQQSLYDGAGNRRQSVEQSLSSGGQLQVSIVSYDYDEADQLVGERKSGHDAYSIRYTYDETGNRLTKLEDGWLTIYDYDANNRLMSVPPPLFVPLNSSSSSSSGSSSSAGSSSSSNAESSSSSSGDASTSSSSSSSSSTQYALLLRYWYDDNGNMIRQQQGAEEVLYHWDTHDKLIGVQYADGTSQSFVYSDDGLRKRVVERDGRILDMVWDGANLLGIVDASTGVMQARFTHAGESYGGLVSQHTQAGSRFYGFDQSANTRLLSDGGGDVSDRYSYSAFGVARQVLGGSFNPHRFGGQVGYFQDEQGRSYVQQRYLDTSNGHWMSSDPIGFAGGLNLYGYVYNNPIGFIDVGGTGPNYVPPKPPIVRSVPAVRGAYRPAASAPSSAASRSAAAASESVAVSESTLSVVLRSVGKFGGIIGGVLLDQTKLGDATPKRPVKPMPQTKSTCASLGKKSGLPKKFGEGHFMRLSLGVGTSLYNATSMADIDMPPYIRTQGWKCTPKNPENSKKPRDCRGVATHYDICCRRGNGRDGRKLWSLQCCEFCFDHPEAGAVQGSICYADYPWGERRSDEQKNLCRNAFG